MQLLFCCHLLTAQPPKVGRAEDNKFFVTNPLLLILVQSKNPYSRVCQKPLHRHFGVGKRYLVVSRNALFFYLAFHLLTVLSMRRKQKEYVCALPLRLLCLLIAFSTLAQAQNVSVLPDSVTVAASEKYSDPSLFRLLFMGKNYRKEWEMPITLPVFNLGKSGLRITELGGGRQTKSLRLEDKDGVEWALRTVDKDVRPAIPKIIRIGLTVSIVQDMVSAAHPFAPLTIPTLAKAAGVIAAEPTFYAVPDDTAFGPYRQLFAGTVCILEKRDILPKVESKGSEKMLADLFESPHNRVDQVAYLNARLLDMLVADWDRHYDQWKWAKLDSGKDTRYLALPKDRDQTYFYTKGLLLRMIRLFGMKFTVGFTSETDNLVKLNRIAWNLDRLLLNALGKAEWQRVADAFQQRITDATIQTAVRNLPPQFYALRGETIVQKLQSRKNTIASDVLKYYRFLSRDVTVYGTDKAEEFILSGNKDSITVTVQRAGEENKVNYQRTFYPGETKTVHLLGLGGDDSFRSDAGLESKIKFVVDGGTGQNHYNLGKKLKLTANDSGLDAGLYLKQLHKPLRIREKE